MMILTLLTAVDDTNLLSLHSPRSFSMPYARCMKALSTATLVVTRNYYAGRRSQRAIKQIWEQQQTIVGNEPVTDSYGVPTAPSDFQPDLSSADVLVAASTLDRSPEGLAEDSN